MEGIPKVKVQLGPSFYTNFETVNKDFVNINSIFGKELIQKMNVAEQNYFKQHILPIMRKVQLNSDEMSNKQMIQMNKGFYQSSIKMLGILLLIQMSSCTKTDSLVRGKYKDSISLTDQRDHQEENNDIARLSEELEGEDEFISEKLFQQWKGDYSMENDVTDGWGRESVSYIELNMIKPDSCIFKSWLADHKGKRYSKDDNYREYFGGIYATANKDSIEFFTKRIIVGGNQELAPLLTLTKNNKDYFIYSFLTSPPHNGIIQMPLEKSESK